MKRRHLLLGGLSAAPLISSLDQFAEGAQAAPRRVVFLVSRNGMWDSNFFPELVSSSPTSDDLGVQGPLGRSPVLGSAFDSLRSKLAIVRGLDGLFNDAHNRAAPLCASSTPGSVFQPPPFAHSIDTILGDAPNVYEADPVLRVLRLSAALNPKTFNNSWSWTMEAEKPRQLPVLSYKAAFAALMGSFPSAASTQVSTVEPKALYSERALERVASRYQRLAKSGRLSELQRVRIENHLTDLRAATAALASPPVAGNNCQPAEELASDTAVKRTQSVLSLLSSALACDLTRVATVDLCAASDAGETDTSWHENSHYPEVAELGPAGLLRYSSWVATRVSEFLTQLEQTPAEDGGTLLDHTLVVWTNELAWGNRHDSLSVPVLLAGASGRLVTGTQFDFRQSGPELFGPLSPRRHGVPYNYLMNTIFEHCGVPPELYERAGAGAGFGQWDDHHAGAYDRFVGLKRQTLGLFV